MVKLPSRRVCWYGKLPTRGDFVGRGLPARWRSDWDGWLQRGLALAATTLEGAALQERLRGFATWRYLALPAPGEIWCGIVVPSHDRVGRAFPLTLVERLAGPVSPGESAARLASLLGAAGEGPEALEAAIAALPPCAAGEEFRSTEAWPPEPSSLWWPLAAASDGLPRMAGWPPEPGLLLELLDIRPTLGS
ncbi:type VI secretion-associated protein, family [Variovorax sp. PBL-H6]|uniref:type VI secretion system-associated protein TagF n=1 Tax=Variovorax sp. PBL-H6 TaxID=434009 RepID=UPI0013166BCD|nr:type VI secretion system-associated protein TagF [Variovorax sp. PBL-H6]VTU24230.1 type VI secretion-associated protein, family [Variovorax sp. PBL-H6]